MRDLGSDWLAPSFLRWLVLVPVLACVGCGAAVSDAYLDAAAMPYDDSAWSGLGVGDTFELRIFREADLSGEYTVGESGVVNFPLIGSLTAVGRTCAALEAELAARLANGFLRDPSIACRVTERTSLRFVVSGQVRSAGRFGFVPGLTIVDAIAMAGGLSSEAREDRLTVTRIVDGRAMEIEVPYREVLAGRAPNFRLWPDDIVTVPMYRLLP